MIDFEYDPDSMAHFTIKIEGKIAYAQLYLQREKYLACYLTFLRQPQLSSKKFTKGCNINFLHVLTCIMISDKGEIGAFSIKYLQLYLLHRFIRG